MIGWTGNVNFTLTRRSNLSIIKSKVVLWKAQNGLPDCKLQTVTRWHVLKLKEQEIEQRSETCIFLTKKRVFYEWGEPLLHLLDAGASLAIGRTVY